MAFTLQPLAETEGVHLSLAACFQEPCWTTWLGRRLWPTIFSTPSTGTSSSGECQGQGRAGQGSHPLLCQQFPERPC